MNRHLISDYGNLLAAISDDFPIAERMVGSAIKYGMEHSDYWFGKIFSFSSLLIIMNPVVPNRNIVKKSRSKDLLHCWYVCVSGSKKCSFFGKFGVLCFLETSVLRFTLLLYYPRHYPTMFWKYNGVVASKRPSPTGIYLSKVNVGNSGT